MKHWYHRYARAAARPVAVLMILSLLVVPLRGGAATVGVAEAAPATQVPPGQFKRKSIVGTVAAVSSGSLTVSMKHGNVTVLVTGSTVVNIGPEKNVGIERINVGDKVAVKLDRSLLPNDKPKDDDGGTATTTDDGGNATTTDDGGNATTTDDGGNATTTDDGGNATTTDDGGNATTTDNGGNATTTDNGGNDGGTATSSATTTAAVLPIPGGVIGTQPVFLIGGGGFLSFGGVLLQATSTDGSTDTSTSTSTDDGSGTSTTTDDGSGTSTTTDDGSGTSTTTDDGSGTSTTTDDGSGTSTTTDVAPARLRPRMMATAHRWRPRSGR